MKYALSLTALIVAAGSLCIAQNSTAQTSTGSISAKSIAELVNNFDQSSDAIIKKLRDSHDLRLESWGPFSSKYNGISHIPDQRLGNRFDLTVMPGIYRRKFLIPHVRWESGYHPWLASGDLNFVSYRYEIEWKDRVYMDSAFVKINDSTRLIRNNFVNNTSADQNLTLYLLGNLNVFNKTQNCTIPVLPEGSSWVNAVPYRAIRNQNLKPGPKANLVWDGQLRCENWRKGATLGTELGKKFGFSSGDFVKYILPIKKYFSKPALTLRYRATGDTQIKIKIQTTSEDQLAPQSVTVDIKKSTAYSTVTIPLQSELVVNRYEVTVTPTKPFNSIALDGFTITESKDAKAISFKKSFVRFTPRILPGPVKNSFILKYPGLKNYYGICWDYPHHQTRLFIDDKLENLMHGSLHNHTAYKFTGNKKGHFTGAFLRPIPIKPKSNLIINSLLVTGSKSHITKSLKNFAANPKQFENKYKLAKSRAVAMQGNPAGNKYKFSQQKMAATLLTNTYYPIRTQGQFIKHYQPGKWWLSLYTWDAGFAGIGLAGTDTNRAIDILNTYLTPQKSESAFIHHGTPLPIQIYLANEIWIKTQDKKLLAYFYPRLKQYHDFLAGRLGSSNTKSRLKSNLLNTWTYFYNSGGWDDYPPQVATHKKRAAWYTAPVINTANAIRTAKILKMFAQELDKNSDSPEYKKDISAYENDIKIFSQALQKYSWDKNAGYFSYVIHNRKTKLPSRKLMYDSKTNYNMGLGGASPLYAGICTKDQQQVLLRKLKDPKKLWTKIGLSAVDQSAPYYKIDGYWNGSVWFPHQWFFFKSAFDLGDETLAKMIADTALDTWKNEVNYSYNCFEHFVIAGGRGAGWHQFGALSGPITYWYNSMYVPGTITAGFDTWITNKKATSNTLKADLEFSKPQNQNMLWICLDQSKKYTVKINSKPVKHKLVKPGLIMIKISGMKSCSVEINPRKPAS